MCCLSSGSTSVSCSSGAGDSIFDANRPSEAISTDFTTAARVPFSGFLQARDEDRDPLTFRIVTSPTLGTLELIDSTAGQFRYQSEVAGTDSFGFRVNDGREDSNLGRVRVTVGPAVTLTRAARVLPDAPIADELAVDPHDPSHWLRVRDGQLFESFDAGERSSRASLSGLDAARSQVSSMAFAADAPESSIFWSPSSRGRRRAAATSLRRR